MLHLVFQLGASRYAIEARCIAEVLPLPALKPLPQSPPGLAGIFSYHGRPVPVIDLSVLALARPAAARRSTRLVLVHFPIADANTALLGLIAEQATRTQVIAPEAFADTGVRCPSAPYLGPVAADAPGLIQRIELAELLPPALRALLFCPSVEAACP